MNPAIERKLNTIYDLLDAREFKKALKLTQTCIQKQNHSVFYAAEALIYQRMGKISDALEKAAQLRTGRLEDRATIEILTMIYRSLGMAKEAAAMYELQYEQQPILETAESLFTAYATDFDVDKQFSLCMKLMKSSTDSKYTLWAVLSLVLSVEIGKNKASSLNLAEQLLTKLTTKPDYVESEQIIRILLAIYRIGSKSDKMISLLQSKGQLLGNEAEKVEVIAGKLREMGQGVEAMNLVEEVLKGNLRQETALSVWQLYTLYLDLAAEMVPANTPWQSIVPSPSPSFSGFSASEDGLSVCCKVLANLRLTQQALTSSSSFARNIRRTGLLAELELFRLLYCKGKIGIGEERQESESPFDAPLLEYVQTYCDIPSAPEDLVPYFTLLTQGQAERLTTALQMRDEDPISTVRREICYIKVKRYLGTLSSDPLQSLTWFRTYKALTTVEPPPKKGEHRAGDELLLLGCELLRASDHPLKTPLVLLMLSYGTQASPYNFNLKIRLMQEWEGLGFVGAVFQLYQDLDIKAIQHETLGHLVLPLLFHSPSHLSDLQSFCHKVEHFHRTAITDLADSILTAYNHFNYEGIRDFWMFKEKLMASKLRTIVELSGVYGKIMEKFQLKIREIAGVLKDSVPTLKRLLVLPDTATSLCDNAVFYSCAPLSLRVPGWSPASSSPNPPSKSFGIWSDIHYFRGFTGMLIFTTNFLHLDLELFNHEELDLVKTELELAATTSHPDDYHFIFSVFICMLKWASSILVTAKGDARMSAEAADLTREMTQKVKEAFEEAGQRLGNVGSSGEFWEKYHGCAHWVLVFGSIILAAMEAVIPEPRKKKGKKMDESQVMHLKLTTLTKEFGAALKGLQQAALSAVQSIQGREGLEQPLTEAFTLVGELADVPEFLSEVQAKCSREQSQPLSQLHDWLQAFPLPRVPDS